jgi:acetylornithine deacetylase/succinyl-diaminopimelate desuccinylase-like protein
MTDKINTAIDYAHQNEEKFLQELIEFCKLPSVSTDPDHKLDMVKTAEWVAEKLKSIGIENVKVMETSKHPVVYGDYIQAGDDAPVISVYGHYDVQPVDPIELWDIPPFEPTLRDGNLYARGASDMKGQVLAGIFAIQSILKNDALPVNPSKHQIHDRRRGRNRLPKPGCFHQRE